MCRLTGVIITRWDLGWLQSLLLLTSLLWWLEPSMDRTGAGQATQATGLAGAELDDAIIKPVLTAALEERTDRQTGGGARHHSLLPPCPHHHQPPGHHSLLVNLICFQHKPLLSYTLYSLYSSYSTDWVRQGCGVHVHTSLVFPDHYAAHYWTRRNFYPGSVTTCRYLPFILHHFIIVARYLPSQGAFLVKLFLSVQKLSTLSYW